MINSTRERERNSGKKGFTFLEILVVLTLVAVLMGMAVPQFFAFFTKPHQAEFQHLNRVLKMLRNDAILRSTSYCLVFDVRHQKMWAAAEEPDGQCSEEIILKPKTIKPHEFTEELPLKQAWLVDQGHSAFAPASDILEVSINRSGFVTPFSLLFSNQNSESWSIESEGIMGKLNLTEK